MIITSKKAFTLVEVLIVVIIIGILASLALPLYRRAVEKAKVAEAVQILDQIRKAEHVYYLRNNEYADALDSLAVDIPADGETLFDYGLALKTGEEGFIATATRNTNAGGTAGIPLVEIDEEGELNETWTPVE